MASNMNLHVDRVHFGIAPPGSKLGFSVRPDKGFAVRAALDCDMKTVATWEWIELQGGLPQKEALVPEGTYTLTLDVAFMGPDVATVVMDFSLGSKRKTLSFSGIEPDIGRAFAVVFIMSGVPDA